VGLCGSRRNGHMLRRMRTLIFDIETIASLRPEAAPAVEKLAAGREWTVDRYAALCPPLARVACIAAREVPSGAFVAWVDNSLAPTPLPATLALELGDGSGVSVDVEVIACNDEADLLRHFGERLDVFCSDRDGRVATFNGRGFDLPVLLHRSVVHQVRPGRQTLAQLLQENRFRPQRHIDVMDAVTHFGATSRWPLAAYAIGYGYRSPKEDMDGAQVSPAVAAGRIADVARYCAGDVLATEFVLRRWED